MNIAESIRSRRSIRGYTTDPVPAAVLEEVLQIASRAPSSRNFQPWKADVIAGGVLEAIKQDNVAEVLAGVWPHAEVLSEDARDEAREPAFRERQVAVAKKLFGAMGIQRGDAWGRQEWLIRGFRFFDAPAVIVLSAPDALSGPVMAFNVGLFAQSVCLAAMDFQLGTCIAQQGVSYPEVIRRHTGIPKSQRIVIGISIGYPDPAFPANDVRTEREPFGAFARWHGFGEGLEPG